ncbi:MAG: cell division protein FtsW [Flavobacteriales bacterium]|mgnify:FL=1|nr:MAG: cell division protein FtsW [Flavobacteriales bacterium TMED96]RZP12146.1 MAG: cell division protein FtsW [Flavobacteriales bacterium]
MKRKLFQGDKVLWGLLALLAIFSFFPIFSASSNLSYVIGTGSPWQYLLKHTFILITGFLLIMSVHKVPFYYFKGISILLLPVVILMLFYTISQGKMIDGVNASRWIKIPLIGISFQTSSLASLILMIYLAYYLDKIKEKKIDFKKTLFPLWVPVFLVFTLVFPTNLSTALIFLFTVFLILIYGCYPVKYLLNIFLVGFLLLTIFIFLAIQYPEKAPDRLYTWINRVENYFNPSLSKDGNYQVQRAKIAIATGGITGLGVGKSVMKNFLPQSSSDFIYAIIVEEFGLLGGIMVILIYLLILLRITVILHHASSAYAKLLIIAAGLPIIIQAFINIGVALNIFPVTGQTLPLLSSGGSAAWVTCIAFGIILSVSEERFNEGKVNQNKTVSNPLLIISEE